MLTTRVSPRLIFDTLGRAADIATLRAAVELDVFTAIGEGNLTPEALAQHCKTSERGMRILCDTLVVIGFLLKNGRTYALTYESATFLDSRSPACLSPTIQFLASPISNQALDFVTEAVRKGGTPLKDGSVLKPDHVMWVQFARNMEPLARMPAECAYGALNLDPGKPCRVLDIAAGHGEYGITIARRHSDAQITALDWPAVLDVAKENAERAGVSSRYHTLPGDAFKLEFGGGFDVVLVAGLLHFFDSSTCQMLLRKAASALMEGGRIVIVDFILNEDRLSPPTAAKRNMMALATTPSGDIHTFAEYERMVHDVGLHSVRLYPIPSSPQQIVLATKSVRRHEISTD